MVKAGLADDFEKKFNALKILMPEHKYTVQVDAEEKDANAVLSFCLSQRPGLRNMRKLVTYTIPFDQ